jgi:hypothetical protein
MRFGSLVVAFSLCLAAASQTPMTVEKLAAFLRNAVNSTDYKYTDRDLAGFLANVKMTERLDDRTIEDLQGQIKLGPLTLARLRMLRDQSQSLVAARPVVAPLPPVPIPPPSSEEQAAMLDEVRDYALNYSANLPDYICTQVTTRYAAPLPGTRYGGAAGDSPHWQQLDKLTIRLSYSQKDGENYKLILMNNTPTQEDYKKLGGATSRGDFGTMMRQIFERHTETRFEWDHWGTLRGRRVMAFSYRVALGNSQYHIGVKEENLDIIVGYHGLVEVDKETHKIMRVTTVADDIPPGFPIRDVKSTLDYDYVEISGHTFLLPLKGNVIATGRDFVERNDNEFRIYRKYEAESTISFDAPDLAPLPDDKTKETPDPAPKP